nr:FAD:protein FMN transferase [Nakamurella flavida]
MTFDLWSTTGTVRVTDPAALGVAHRELRAELDDIEIACSRFRPDSEITAVNRAAGSPVVLSPVLNAAVTTALRVARATDGLVDPTVLGPLVALGYDRDIGDLPPAGLPVQPGSGSRRHQPVLPAPGYWRIRHDPVTRELLMPAGVGLDLGATAKALAADRAARRIARAIGAGVLVDLGGDIAVHGPAPRGGWRIAVHDDHRVAATSPASISITGGGVATSSTTTRRWSGPAGEAHHLVDPRSGGNPAPCWRTVSVCAATAVDANAAATAAIILGPAAPGWLAGLGLPARLVTAESGPAPARSPHAHPVRIVAGWPTDQECAA